MMFASVFAMLTWFYTIITGFWFSENLGSPFIIVVLDGLNAVFYFCGAIALAAVLGVHSCNNQLYLISNPVTNGIVGNTPVGSSQICRQAQASDAFAWFAFALYLATALIVGLSGGLAGGRVKAPRVPPMSHV